ncbi:hypothetical protein SLS53_000064 [Cytospora paraplurivora]|uniref:Uncharacterized protein n=1 Tax=Cytospora paraplurivora TaxID=2898453 RepID=A0AAN9UTY9_9PEZI
MSPFVDFFVLLESPSIDELTPKPEPTPEQDWWERDVGHVEPAPPSTAPVLPPTDADALSFLDKIWDSRLYPYHDKIIRRTLSRFSSEFAPGQDHVAAAQNAVYTQVVPFLTGPQKPELGDVLIMSDIEEILRPVTLQVLRNCAIPHITTVRTRKYWYSFQWMRMDGAPVSRKPDPEPETEPPISEELPEDSGLAKRSDNAAIHGRSNEHWSHPQVTIYEGTQTIMPDVLRKDRSRDEYTFADGGWTCKLCYGSISETLTRAGQMGLIWHHGPRWKSAGRTVNRFMRGVDLFDRTNLSRIEANPDIPFYLRDNPHRFPWMLDRDGHGAGFIDFDEAEYQAYLAKQDEVDAEKDIEDGTTPHIWNIATTQPWNDPEFAPALDVDNMPVPFRYPIPHVGPGDSWADGGPQPQINAPELSEEDRVFLEEAKKKIDSGLSAADIAILEHLAEGQSLPAYGED